MLRRYRDQLIFAVHIKAAPLTKKHASPSLPGNVTHMIAISYEIETSAPNPVHHYALLLDDQRPKECDLYRIEADYKTVFSIPCTTGDVYLAPGWTREQSYTCAHAMMRSISSNDAKKYAKELISACSGTPALLHPAR
jgi:hypothetical protein